MLPLAERAPAMTDETTEFQSKDALRERLAGSREDLIDFLAEVHAADLAVWLLDFDEDESWRVFEALDPEQRAEVLEQSEDSLREELLGRLTPKQVAELVDELPADEVVDMLSHLDAADVEHVLRDVNFERAKGLRQLASYEPESAGGVMSTEFVAVPAGTRVGDAIKLIKTEGDEVEEGHGLFVVDEQEKPIGYVTDRVLLTNSIHDEVDRLMVDPYSVPVDLDQEEAANVLSRYGLTELAVVEDDGRLVGSITIDDAQEVLEDEASEDMFKLVGTSAELQTRLPIWRRVLARIPLQAVTVLGGLVTAAVIDALLPAEPGGVISEGRELLAFVPIVIGLAGNVGIQASTILVRAFATGEVEPDRELSVLGSETLVGLIIGLICGLATFSATCFWKDLDTAMAIGVAITCAVTWAAFLGCGVPMVCRRIGIDPALIAGPFLITVSDISGTSLYLGVALLLTN